MQRTAERPPPAGQNRSLRHEVVSQQTARNAPALFRAPTPPAQKATTMKTTQPKESEVIHKWYLIDATDKPAGRLAVDVCRLLRGRGKPDYTPHIDMGDFVVVTNCSKIKLTGRKETGKTYAKYTRYQSGLTETPAEKIRAKDPGYILVHAVRGMLPKNRLSRQLIKRLKTYAGAEHPHAAQNPEVIG